MRDPDLIPVPGEPVGVGHGARPEVRRRVDQRTDPGRGLNFGQPRLRPRRERRCTQAVRHLEVEDRHEVARIDGRVLYEPARLVQRVIRPQSGFPKWYEPTARPAARAPARFVSYATSAVSVPALARTNANALPAPATRPQSMAALVVADVDAGEICRRRGRGRGRCWRWCGRRSWRGCGGRRGGWRRFRSRGRRGRRGRRRVRVRRLGHRFGLDRPGVDQERHSKAQGGDDGKDPEHGQMVPSLDHGVKRVQTRPGRTDVKKKKNNSSSKMEVQWVTSRIAPRSDVPSVDGRSR